MPSNLTDEGLRAWKALLNAHDRATEAIERRLLRAGKISLTWYDVLWTLKKSEAGRLRFRDLQENVVLSRSALSRCVDALAKAGLVEKKSCPGDLRGLEVEVTAQGRRALVRAWPIYRQGIVEHFTRHLTDVECQQLSAILSKIGLP